VINDTSPPENAPRPAEKPFQFSLRAMLIGVAVVALLLGILVPLVRLAQRDARHSQCSYNLKLIALALHNYHDVHRCFPFAQVCGPDGKPWHSWRIAILPYVESTPYYNQYSFDEPWDGPNNRTLHPVELPYYHCPAEHASVPATMTSYLAVVGPGTAWPVPGQTQLRDFRDGTSNSILVVEVVDSGIHWMEPRDLKLEDLPLAVNPESGKGISSNHIGGACICFADGAIHFLSNDLAAETLRKMITIDGGEMILRDEITPDR
jgi:hypothetical protein